MDRPECVTNPTVLSLCDGMMVKVWSGAVKWKPGRQRKRRTGRKREERKEERTWKQGRMSWKIIMQGKNIDRENDNSNMGMVMTCPIRQLVVMITSEKITFLSSSTHVFMVQAGLCTKCPKRNTLANQLRATALEMIILHAVLPTLFLH